MRSALRTRSIGLLRHAASRPRRMRCLHRRHLPHSQKAEQAARPEGAMARGSYTTTAKSVASLGWVQTTYVWKMKDLQREAMGIAVKDNANLDISSYETLAQGFLLVLLLRTISGGRLRVRLPALSDNVGAESVINRLYTSKQPLALFVQRLAMWACAHAVSLACSHIAGEKNVEADALSRWDESCPIPHGFAEGTRVRISLRSFWDVQIQPQLLPADTFVQWRLPQQQGPWR